MIGNARQYVGEVVLRVETVEFGAFDQGVHRRGAPAASMGAGEEVILAADRDAAQRALGRVVVEREPAVVEAAHQRGPARPHVAERGGELGFARQVAPGLVGPGGQRRCDRLRSFLAFASSMIGHEPVDLLLDLVKPADAVERLLGDRRAIGGMHIEELSPDVMAWTAPTPWPVEARSPRMAPATPRR